MTICVLCYECGEDIAEIYPFWATCKRLLIEDLLNNSKDSIDVDKLNLKSDITDKFGFVLDALKINKMCCRIHILGNTDFDILY